MEGLLNLGFVVDADDASAFHVFEFDFAFDGAVERVVVADAYVCAGAEFCASLANEDHAGFDDFAGVAFDAEAVGVAVATVFGRTLTFLMCHIVYLPPPTTSVTCRKV